jgi:hypothetical protein
LRDRPTHAAKIPEELPVGSVVVDAEQIAWQSHSSGFPNMSSWYPAIDPAVGDVHNGAKPQSWAGLVATRGPLTELYRPDEGRVEPVVSRTEPAETRPTPALSYLRQLATDHSRESPAG